MGSQVEASTIHAGQLFSTTTFTVPDFQRIYSWDAKEEVAEFWNDLESNIDSPPYFLGLLIVTDEGGSKTIVDGQQRLITLTLLANAVRKAATIRNRHLVADSMRDVFLYALDYETEMRNPKLRLTAERDRRSLEVCLTGQVRAEYEGAQINGKILAAQNYLHERLERDLSSHEASSRLGKWARFISHGLTFAFFEHPDRNAAYKVYEVVNTRGKDLTPAELIKSYLFAASDPTQHQNIYAQWNRIEQDISDVGGVNTLTQFIRHVITLSKGYVLPRDLYQEISKTYEGARGVSQLLSQLEEQLPLYLQMLDPSLDIDRDDEILRAFKILEALSLSTVRPIFMATAKSQDAVSGYSALMRIMIARVAVGSFGTGNIERRFADAAREISITGRWEPSVERLQDLMPSRDELVRRLASRAFSRQIALVLRSAVLQGTLIPNVDGYVHYIRPRTVEYWTGFSDDEFKLLGTTIGNSFISSAERRPRGTNNPTAVEQRLLPTAVATEELTADDVQMWTAGAVRAWNQDLAGRGGDLFHG